MKVNNENLPSTLMVQNYNHEEYTNIMVGILKERLKVELEAERQVLKERLEAEFLNGVMCSTEVMNYLKIGKTTLQNLIKDKRLPVAKYASANTFSRKDIVAFFNNQIER